MSKESAMVVATGNPTAQVTPSLVAGSPPTEGLQTPQEAQTQLASTPFSLVARKEAALLEQKQQFKREREAFAAEEAKVREYQQKLQQFEEAKKTDPVAAMKMLGFSETDIFNYMANQAPPEISPEEKAVQAATQAAEARINAFEEEQAKRIQTEQAERDSALIQSFKTDISKIIQSNAEKYEYCAYYGAEAEALAYELTLAVVKESQGAEVLTPDQALQMAEEYFEEKDREMMTKLKKRQPKEAPVEAPKAEPTRTRTLSTPPGAEAPKPTITKTRTLHSGATSSIAAARHTRNETREQKKERLMSLLRSGT